MAAFDSNRDGRLDVSVQIDRIEHKVADVDADGALTPAEFSRVEGKYR